MLIEPTIQKLQAMKLNGMAEAYAEQRMQARSAELSFDERLFLLVERQWLWKSSRLTIWLTRSCRVLMVANMPFRWKAINSVFGCGWCFSAAFRQVLKRAKYSSMCSR